MAGKLNFDTVRRIALTLPDVEESTTHGAPSLKIRGKLLTCPAIHSSAEPGSIGVRIDFDQRAELIAAAPDTYYLTDHYVDHPVVLVRLSHIRLDALQDLLLMAWKFVSARPPARKRRARKAKRF